MNKQNEIIDRPYKLEERTRRKKNSFLDHSNQYIVQEGKEDIDTNYSLYSKTMIPPSQMLFQFYFRDDYEKV